MKIATYNDGSRDGQLVVVSRDLTMAHYAAGITSRLQQVLDDWNFLSPQLEELSQTLNHGKARHAFAFDPRMCMAPLPRVFYFASSHSGQPTADAAPALHLRRGDRLLGACHPRPTTGTAMPMDDQPGLRLVASLAVITGDLKGGAAAEDSLAAVRLITFCAMELPAADEPAAADASSTRFAPVAVTPDELGSAWHGDTLGSLRVQIVVNDRNVPSDGTGWPTTARIGSLLARCAGRPGLCAGSIVASGLADGAVLSAAGSDSLRITVEGSDGASVFGAISEQGDSARQGCR